MAGPSNALWSDMSDEATPRAILERIDSLWTSVGPALGALPTHALNAPLGEQQWCPRELMSHLAHWNEAHWFAISEHVAGRTADIYAAWRGKNERWFQDDATVAATDAFARFKRSHSDLHDLLHGLSPDQWEDQIRAFALQCPIRHYREHLAALVP